MEQGKQIKIDSVSSYIKAIFDLCKSRLSEHSRSSYWIFRGQKNSQWSINPNIFRGDALHYEFDSIDKAVRLRPNDFRECSTNFEILTINIRVSYIDGTITSTSSNFPNILKITAVKGVESTIV